MEKMKNKKIWIAAALICILLGAALLTIGRTIGGIPGFYIDGTGLHTAEEPLHSEVIRGSDTLEPFKSIELDIEYADVELVLYHGGIRRTSLRSKKRETNLL